MLQPSLLASMVVATIAGLPVAGHATLLLRSDCPAELAPPVTQCFSLAASPQTSSAARPIEPKDKFVLALRQFLEAIAGQYGDEGPRSRAATDAMDLALAEWDQAIREDEAAAASQPQTAELHRTLGVIYLDRRRIDDALREFASAAKLAPKRPDVAMLRGFALNIADKPADAALALAQAAELDADDPTGWYRWAQHLRSRGQLEQAAKAWQQFRISQQKSLAQPRSRAFIRVDLVRQAAGVAPIFPPALYADGFAALNQGRYGEAVARFKEAAARDNLGAPDSTSDRTLAGAAALRQAELTTAIGHFRAAADAAPDAAEGHRLLGMAYWADEQYDNGIDQFKAAIRLRPGDERSRVALADTLVAAGRLPEAEQAYKDAMRVTPTSGQAAYNLGRLYDFQQRWSEAAKVFWAAARLNPVVGLDHLYQTLARVSLAQPDFEQAIEAATKRVDVNPNNSDAHRAVGDMYLQLGRHDEALTELLAALLVNPRSAESWTGIAQVHLRTGRYLEAVEASQRALAVDAGLTPAQFALATALVRVGRTEEGAKAIERFQQLQAEVQLRDQRAWDLKMLKQEASVSLAKDEYDRAIIVLQKAIAYEPGSADSYLTLGLVLKKTGRYLEAVESFTKAEALQPGPDVYRLLAETYEALGRPEEGQKYRATYTRVKAERLRSTGWGR